MKIVQLISCLVIINLLTGCATILAGRNEMLTVQTNPPGASCDLSREGRIIGSINPSPGAVMVDKTKHDIIATCHKPDYQDGTAYLDSGIEGAVYGNIILGGLIGWAVDSAVGADNKYPEVTTVTLIPKLRGSMADVVRNTSEPSLTIIKPAKADKPGAASVEERLQKLEKLKEKKLVTEDEYQKLKEKIFKDI